MNRIVQILLVFGTLTTTPALWSLPHPLPHVGPAGTVFSSFVPPSHPSSRTFGILATLCLILCSSPKTLLSDSVGVLDALTWVGWAMKSQCEVKDAPAYTHTFSS
jgi:hypothetical protein